MDLVGTTMATRASGCPWLRFLSDFGPFLNRISE